MQARWKTLLPAHPHDSGAASIGGVLGGDSVRASSAGRGAAVARRRLRRSAGPGGGGPARRGLRLPRLVRVARTRADAEGSARRRRLRRSGTAAQIRAYRCSSPTATRTATRRRCSSRRRAAAVPSGAPRRRSGRPATLAAHRLLPAAARRSRTSSGSSSGAVAAFFVVDPQLVRDALHGHARRARSTASSARFVRYRFHVYAFLTLAANPFPGFTGEAGELSARSRASRGAAAPEPLEDLLPGLPRDPGVHRRLRRSSFALFTAAFLTWFVRALPRHARRGGSAT